MLCSQCNKFASYDEPQVDWSEPEIDEGEVTMSARVVLPSACCGTELKEWLADLSGSFDHDTSKGDHELEVEAEDGVVSDYYDNPGRPSRYRRHIYRIEITAHVTCSCGFAEDVQMSEENRASGFDELS